MNGTGTDTDPYLIGSVNDFVEFFNVSIADNTDSSSNMIYAELTDDIDFKNGNAEFEIKTVYNITLDGCGYSIKNYFVDRTDILKDTDWFGNISIDSSDMTNPSEIKNINFKNITLIGNNHSTYSELYFLRWSVCENIAVANLKATAKNIHLFTCTWVKEIFIHGEIKSLECYIFDLGFTSYFSYYVTSKITFKSWDKDSTSSVFLRFINCIFKMVDMNIISENIRYIPSSDNGQVYGFNQILGNALKQDSSSTITYASDPVLSALGTSVGIYKNTGWFYNKDRCEIEVDVAISDEEAKNKNFWIDKGFVFDNSDTDISLSYPFSDIKSVYIPAFSNVPCNTLFCASAIHIKTISVYGYLNVIASYPDEYRPGEEYGSLGLTISPGSAKISTVVYSTNIYNKTSDKITFNIDAVLPPCSYHITVSSSGAYNVLSGNNYIECVEFDSNNTEYKYAPNVIITQTDNNYSFRCDIEYEVIDEHPWKIDETGIINKGYPYLHNIPIHTLNNYNIYLGKDKSLIPLTPIINGEKHKALYTDDN